jgi:hypothetical protein
MSTENTPHAEEFIDCPEILQDGSVCGMPGEITKHDFVASTDGLVEIVGTLYLNNHHLFGPPESLFPQPDESGADDRYPGAS